MKFVLVASRNPVKIAATENAFRACFPDIEFRFEGQAAPSGVADQPMSDEETLTGARNRVAHIQAAFPDVDFWVGLEGGIEDTPNGMEAFAWMVVHSPFSSGEARSAAFRIPNALATLVRSGKELGEADDIVFAQRNSKQAGGAVGLLTNQVVTRTTLYQQAVTLALIPFLHPEL